MRDDDGRGRQVDKLDNTHPMKTSVDKMPWHSETKPFGVSQEDWDNRKHERWSPTPNPTTLIPLPENEDCYCGARGVIFLGRWYCRSCWSNGDDEDEQLDYGGHA